MMVMYAYLDVSKAAVRGTNSVMSLVQVSLPEHWQVLQQPVSSGQSVTC